LFNPLDKRAARIPVIIIIIIIPCSILAINYLPTLIRIYNDIFQAPYLYQIADNNLRIELVADGLAQPTSMTFVDEDTILVLEKDTGMIRVVNNGTLEKIPHWLSELTLMLNAAYLESIYLKGELVN
jgi:hypothetical protein